MAGNRAARHRTNTMCVAVGLARLRANQTAGTEGGMRPQLCRAFLAWARGADEWLRTRRDKNDEHGLVLLGRLAYLARVGRKIDVYSRGLIEKGVERMRWQVAAGYGLSRPPREAFIGGCLAPVYRSDDEKIPWTGFAPDTPHGVQVERAMRSWLQDAEAWLDAGVDHNPLELLGRFLYLAERAQTLGIWALDRMRRGFDAMDAQVRLLGSDLGPPKAEVKA